MNAKMLGALCVLVLASRSGAGANLTAAACAGSRRHGLAALLDAAHADVDYPFGGTGIAAVLAGDADTLEEFDERGCPLR